MNQETLNHFSTLFKTILSEHELEVNDELKDLTPKTGGDEADLATIEKDLQLELKLKGRKSFFVKKIENALVKIENGTFGACEDCDCDISTSRLLARPTATLCITCKEEEELGQKHIPYQKKSHTLGKELANHNVIHIQFGEDGNNGKQMPTKSLPN